MTTSALVFSIVFTVGVLILSLVTISKGYGFKHTIDPLEENEDRKNEK